MNRLSAVDLQRFKIGPLHQSHPRITLRSLNVSGDELDAPHLDVATRLLALCPYVEPAIRRPLKGMPIEIERVDIGGHQWLHQSTLTRLAGRRRGDGKESERRGLLLLPHPLDI